MNIGMIFVQPMLFFPRQETLVNQSAAVRDHGNMLKAQVGFVPELVLCFDLFHHDDVLDSDSEGPVFVVSRLV